MGFALYVWMLTAVCWALVLVTRTDRTLGIGLAAVLLVLFVHSLLYAGFFEDPLTWGVFGLDRRRAVARSTSRRPHPIPLAATADPGLLAH